MIGPSPGARVFLACGVTDMRRGMDSLAALVQQSLGADPFDGSLYSMARFTPSGAARAGW